MLYYMYNSSVHIYAYIYAGRQCIYPLSLSLSYIYIWVYSLTNSLIAGLYRGVTACH